MLYKYRSLENFQFTLDILVNQRLFAATIDTMNDPMEGYYTADPDIPPTHIKALAEQKKSIKFCSLSEEYNNPLMWAHYANGSRGVAIGVEVKEGSDLREVKYGSHSHLIASKTTEPVERARQVLCYKADFWQYEREQRIFATAGDKHVKGNYINVKVKEIVFGENTDRSQQALLTRIIEKVNPKIEVIAWSKDIPYSKPRPLFNTK